MARTRTENFDDMEEPEDRKRTVRGFVGREGEPLSGVVTHSNELWIRLQKKMT